MEGRSSCCPSESACSRKGRLRHNDKHRRLLCELQIPSGPFGCSFCTIIIIIIYYYYYYYHYYYHYHDYHYHYYCYYILFYILLNIIIIVIVFIFITMVVYFLLRNGAQVISERQNKPHTCIAVVVASRTNLATTLPTPPRTSIIRSITYASRTNAGVVKPVRSLSRLWPRIGYSRT